MSPDANNVATWLLGTGAPEAVAILHGEKEVTYAELRNQAGRIGRFLVGAGCARGDRIAIWSENSPFFVAAYLGIIQAGLVAVPLQLDTPREELTVLLQRTGSRFILTSSLRAEQLRASLSGCGINVASEAEIETGPGAIGHAFRDVDVDSELAALMFTSGSEGQPKGVMVSHGNIYSNTQDIVDYLELTASDRAMVVLPFHYCYGLSVLHSHLAAGGSLVINNQFMYPEAVLTDMQERQCTGLAGVPSTYQILLRKSRFRDLQFPSLRWLQQAGGKLPNPYIREILEALPHVRFFLMYGQTEATARLSFLPPERLHDKLGSIGRGIPSTKLEVLRPDGTPVEPGSDEVGEIVATGENITRGYWNDPGETSRYFRNGRLHTGDLARVDVDGFIFIVDRERDLIKSGGNRVSAKEVEDVIAEMPEVVEVAVVGVPHAILGEAIVAFVAQTPAHHLTMEDVLRHCGGRLPASRRPKSVRFLEALPHSGRGKVAKAKLREMAAEAFA